MSVEQGCRRCELILNSVADGVFTVDRDWNITAFNRAAERITGVPCKEALGRKCFEVFLADVCQAACVLRRTMEHGEELIDFRVNILNAAGRRVPVSVSTAVLRDEQGKIVGGVETFRDLSAVEMLRREIKGRYTFADIVSKNHEMWKMFDVLPDIAVSDSTVLIEGPSGSGKELFAKAVHNLSNRKEGRFVAVNCGALPDTLLASELFGYLKGAFTGAVKDKPGRFAFAEGGTLFLDEIGDVSFALQVKLLRVLQEKEYEPLGAVAPCKSDVRIIAAANKPLAELVARGVFREDLYYRLNIVKLVLPPLAQRREDIPLLSERFIQKFNAEKGKRIERISENTLDILMCHDFPGNVRELQNIIEHAFVLCRGREIEPSHLPKELLEKAVPPIPDASVARPLRQAEAEKILETLEKHKGHRGKTAAELGIDKATLWRKMKKLGLVFPAPLHRGS